MITPGSRAADADVNGNAWPSQTRVPGARYFGIRILQRRNDARDAGRNNGVGAWRRFAVMRARFERDIKRSAACRLASPAQGFDFGVGPAARLSPATTDDFAVFHDDRPDRRIRPGSTEPAAAQ
jgi:hypothetical protein